jgi:hypothetical protein
MMGFAVLSHPSLVKSLPLPLLSFPGALFPVTNAKEKDYD